MKNYLYWIALVLVIVGGVVFAVRFGVKQRAIPKIKLSYFSDTQELVSSWLLRLNLEVKHANILFLGIDPEQDLHFKIVDEFIDQTAKADMAYAKVYMDPYFKNKWSKDGVEVLDIQTNFNEATNLIAKAKEGNKRIMFVVPHVYAAHILDNNPVNRLQESSKTQIVSFSLLPLLVGPEFSHLEIPCRPEGSDVTGQGRLGCVIQRQAGMRSRAAEKLDKIAGFLDQYGTTDYLFFLRPAQSVQAP